MITGVRYSNGRKDKGFKFLIQLVPSRVDDAIAKLEELLHCLRLYKKEIQENPERYDLNVKDF